MNRVFVKTGDGSHTLYVPELKENYHSKNGAIGESMHVFIEAGLNAVTKEEIHLLEIGFGTGLNCLLTLIHSKNESKKIHYTGMELYPLERSITSELNYTNLLGTEYQGIFSLFHECPWNKRIQIEDNFLLLKMLADANDYKFTEKYDLVYFDAFAPEVQPEMWSIELFEKLYNCMNPCALLVTYSAKGSVRRTLQQTGFEVEKLPGAKGKREMLRATKYG